MGQGKGNHWSGSDFLNVDELGEKYGCPTFADVDDMVASNGILYDVDAGDASYADAWAGSKVCYSTDMRTWQRVESTSYDAAKGALCWDFDHSAAPSVIFSYFDLYPYERQLALVADCAAAGAAVGFFQGVRSPKVRPPTQVQKATDSVFSGTLKHIISWHSKMGLKVHRA